MTAYYNEFEPKAAAWLRELIRGGHIAPGDVDERSILDVTPDDLRPYTQCHFFAGIGVWSYALRRAGWPDDRPVWTGSCPCQPFSTAGKRGGIADERHLWPAWQWLIGECRPDVVFGEQVASKDGLAWLDLVRADLEGTGYAFGVFDLCAAGFGAPHIRQRLYFAAQRMADPEHAERWTVGLDREDGRDREDAGRQEAHGVAGARGEIRGMADDDDTGLEGRRQSERECRTERPAGAGVVAGGMAFADGWHAGAERQQRSGQHGQQQEDGRYAVGLDDATGTRHIAERPGAEGETRDEAWLRGLECGRGAGGLGDACGESGERRTRSLSGAKAPVDSARLVDGRGADRPEHASASLLGGLAEPDGAGSCARQRDDQGARYGHPATATPDDDRQGFTGPVNGFWRDADWLACRDERWRPVEPGTFPLAHGSAARVGRLRGYGNAIVAPQAAAFVEAFLGEELDRSLRVTFG